MANIIDSYKWNVNYYEKKAIQAVLEVSDYYNEDLSYDEMKRIVEEKDPQNKKKIKQIEGKCEFARSSIDREIKPELDKPQSENNPELKKFSTVATRQLQEKCIVIINALKRELGFANKTEIKTGDEPEQ